MKKGIRNLILYLIIVIIPLLLVGAGTFFSLLKKDELVRQNQANWIASIHQRSWDQFISETVTSLDIIALAAMANMNSPQKSIPLLQKTQQKDPRYGGLYLLNPKGTVIADSNGLLENTNFAKNAYIQNVIKTKDIIISDHPEILINNHKVIGLAAPILDNNRELIGIIVAHLRIDYIQNIMRVMTPDAKLFVLNSEQKVILRINTESNIDSQRNDWLSHPIESLPWSIHVKIPELKYRQLADAFFRNLFIVFVISHIVFLTINNVLLWRNSIMQKQQNELQKLELVGMLAASTAHEIRNPLTGVKGLMQLLSEKYTTKEDQYYFHVIETELKRINSIVSEFLILGKPIAEKFEKINLVDVIEELQPIILSEGMLLEVSCEWFIVAEPMFVECNKDQMKQVVLNITRNAFESMPYGGKLMISLQKEKDFAKLDIRDSGKGIPKDELEKIFTPFYTSKETGTGLGLVICQRILQTFDGSIKINSEINKGTKVEVTLPLAVD